MFNDDANIGWEYSIIDVAVCLYHIFYKEKSKELIQYHKVLANVIPKKSVRIMKLHIDDILSMNYHRCIILIQRTWSNLRD
jgi:hypothetical protein